MSSRSNRGNHGKSKPSSDFARKHWATKQGESNEIDFVFLLMGMVTTLLVSLLVYSNTHASPATERALTAASTGDATEEVNAIESETEFRELVDGGNKAQLLNVLTGLNQSAKAEVTVRENQRRVDVANQLLAMSLDKSEKSLTVVAKLEALSAIYEISLLNDIDIPNIVETLRDTTIQFVDESDESISRVARICLFKVNSLELTKKADQNIAKITDEMCSLLGAYPDDDEVISTVRQVVAYYRIYVDRAVCQKITSKLNERKAEFASPKSLRLIHEFADEAMLLEARYAQLFDNRKLDGARGQRELLKKSIELAREPEAGNFVIGEIDAVAHWFEQAKLYESESKIYEEFKNSVDNYRDPDVAAVARKKAEDGLKRMDLLGKEIDLSGFQFDGSKIYGSSFEGRFVVVLFWSIDNKESVEFLESLNEQIVEWNESGVSILAVNVDQKKNNQFKKMFAQMTNIDFVFGDANRNFANGILDQCPSEIVPRVMLVNRNGTVENINVALKEVVNEVDFLMGN